MFGARPWAEWRARLDAHGLTFGVVASPLWLDGQPKVPPRFPPGLGEHSVEILREAGCTEEEIQRLLAARAVVQGERGDPGLIRSAS